MIEHELLHCLGFDHEEDPTSIMHENVGRALTKEHANRMRTLHDSVMEKRP